MRIHLPVVLASLSVGALAQTITGRNDCLPAGNYMLCQNLWGANSGVGNQNSTLISTNGNTVSWSTAWTWANNPNNVKAYPNVEHQSAKGVQVGSIVSAPTTWIWRYTAQAPDIRANVAYDLWIGPTTSGTPASPNSDYEIMVWLSGKGGIQPVGSPVTRGICLAGHNWDLWRGPNQNWEVLSFVILDGDEGAFNADLNEFIQYLIENQGMLPTQYLHSIQAGTEPFTGYADLLTESYSVAVAVP